MKKSLFFILFALFSVYLAAEPVSPETAKKVAINYYKNFAPQSITDFTVENYYSAKNGDLITYYIFNFKSGGFVMVSADDAAFPVLAYSHEKNSEKGLSDGLNPAAQQWISQYSKEIKFIVEQKLSNKETKKQWQSLINNKFSKETKDVAQLLTTTWDQGCYYNTLCPADGAGDCGHVWTGCVATASAQIMKYHNYPTIGTGTHTYTDPTYGSQTANFGATTYDWINMPNSVTSGSTQTQKDAVATLMYHCGVAVDMQYGTDGSGAYSEDVPAALINYFGYNSSAEMKSKANYSIEDWKTLLRTELDGARPVYYAGSSTASGGHAFVCDGYRMSDEKFHFNWGWGGYSNGYYLIGTLNPAGSNFNDDNRAIIGVKPPYIAPEVDDAYKLMSNKLDLDSLPNYPLLAYDWVDITDGSGTEISVTDDGVAGPFSLGQEFVYFRDAHKFSQFWIGDNGHINFASATALSATFLNIPNTGGANDFIAPLLGDYAGTGVGVAGSFSKIYYRIDADKFIVTYKNYKHWQQAAPEYSGDITFQAIYYKDGNFKFQYESYSMMNWNNPSTSGDEHDPIIGCENVSGTIGYAWLNYNIPANRRTEIVTNGETFIPGLSILGYYTHKHPLIKDVTMEWVNVEGDEGNSTNKGSMITSGSRNVTLKLTNVGTLDATGIQVRAQITPLGGSTVSSPYQLVGTLTPGETRIITLSETNLPYTYNFTVTAGTGSKLYAVKGVLTCTGDAETTNNSVTTEYMVMEQTATKKIFKWAGNTPYSGVFGFDAGAIEFVPPFNIYPLTIDSIGFFAAQSTETPEAEHNMYIQAFKINVDGTIDIDNPLSPEIAVDMTSILNPSTVTSKRFSTPLTGVVLTEVGTGIAIKYKRPVGALLYTDETGPFSRRNYEILDPMGVSWTAYRNNEVEDAAIFPVCSYTALSTDASLSDLQVDGLTVTGFNATDYDYTVQLLAGTSIVPTVSATTTSSAANAVVTQGELPFPCTATVMVTAEAGNTQSYLVNFDETLSINDISNNIKIYPVPVKGVFNIEYNSDAKVNILDISGKIVYSGNIKNGLNTINTENLSNGVYTLKISDNSNVFTKQINIVK